MVGGETVLGKCGLGSDCGGRGCHRAAQTSTCCKEQGWAGGSGWGQRGLRKLLLQGWRRVGGVGGGLVNHLATSPTPCLPFTGKPPKAFGGALGALGFPGG